MKSTELTDAERKALRSLWDSENDTRMNNHHPFPGAIGRTGNALVKRGFATRWGRFIYANNRPEMGERPDAFVRFELTPLGRKFAAFLFK